MAIDPSRLKPALCAREAFASVQHRGEAAAPLPPTLDHAPIGITLVSLDGRILRVNDKLCEILGYASDELRQRRFQDITYCDDLEANQAMLERAIAGQTTNFRMEKRYIRGDGTIVWADVTVSLVRDAAERPQYFITIINDITARKHTEKALRESEERSRQQLAELEAIYATAPVGLAVIDADCRFLRLNERLAEMNGLPVAAHLGRTVREVLPQFGNRFEEIMRRVMETGEPVLDFEAEGETEAQPGVKRAWVEQWLPQKDADGRVVCVNFVVEEVTERKATEAALRRVNETLEQRVAKRTTELQATSAERARLASVAENSPDFIGICDLDMQVIYVNPAGRRLVGIESDEELRRRTPLEYFAPEERAAVVQEVSPSVLRDGHWVGELTFQNFRTGERILVLHDVFRIDDPTSGKPSHYATVTRDLRDRKQAEERLRQAQKMEAVGQLTGGIAHDFNNLLTVIMGNLERLRARLEDQPHLGRMIEAIEQAAERGERLTGQLLAFSRRQNLRPETLDLNRLIRGFEPLIRQAVGESVHVEAHLAPELWPCTIDAAQLETALLNLAVNARDAMPKGGSLVVETQNVARDDRLIARVADASSGPYVTLTVSDTGTGMPPEVMALAFEPFFTTKEVGKGSGLGLSQVYGFVEQSGGHVTIDSALGQGTIVRLYLPPMVNSAATHQLIRPCHIAIPARGSEHILLVEDDGHVLRAATQMMIELGYAVCAVAGPLEALEILRGDKCVDLLFSDVVMPNMSGVQLAEEARRLRPGLKVLLTSGYSREGLWSRTVPEEGVSILSKPYKQSDLAAQLRAVLDAQ